MSSNVKIDVFMCRTCLSSTSTEGMRSILDTADIKPEIRYIDIIKECASHNVSKNITF